MNPLDKKINYSDDEGYASSETDEKNKLTNKEKMNPDNPKIPQFEIKAEINENYNKTKQAFDEFKNIDKSLLGDVSEYFYPKNPSNPEQREETPIPGEFLNEKQKKILKRYDDLELEKLPDNFWLQFYPLEKGKIKRKPKELKPDDLPEDWKNQFEDLKDDELVRKPKPLRTKKDQDNEKDLKKWTDKFPGKTADQVFNDKGSVPVGLPSDWEKQFTKNTDTNGKITYIPKLLRPEGLPALWDNQFTKTTETDGTIKYTPKELRTDEDKENKKKLKEWNSKFPGKTPNEVESSGGPALLPKDWQKQFKPEYDWDGNVVGYTPKETMPADYESIKRQYLEWTKQFPKQTPNEVFKKVIRMEIKPLNQDEKDKRIEKLEEELKNAYGERDGYYNAWNSRKNEVAELISARQSPDNINLQNSVNYGLFQNIMDAYNRPDLYEVHVDVLRKAKLWSISGSPEQSMAISRHLNDVNKCLEWLERERQK